MAGEGGGQDWWGLLYLFLAGIVSVAVDFVRRMVAKIGDDDDEDKERPHRRNGDAENHYHRRKDDPPEEDE